MGCFALAASLTDARSHVNHFVDTVDTFDIHLHTHRKHLSSPPALIAGVDCLPDRAYFTARLLQDVGVKLNFSSSLLCVMLVKSELKLDGRSRGQEPGSYICIITLEIDTP